MDNLDLRDEQHLRTFSAIHGMQRYNGLVFGVEIEIEIDAKQGIPYFPYPKEWILDLNEGSVKDGAEYILEKPLSFEKLKTALLEWRGSMLKHGLLNRMLISDRCGVHIHLNMTDRTPEFLRKFLLVYYLVEQILVRLGPRNRADNHFCVTLLKSPALVRSIMLRKFEGGLGLEEHKYACLNLALLDSLGTVEFRGMATPTKPGNIVPILNMARYLKNVYEYADALEVELPAWLQMLSAMGLPTVVSTILNRDVSSMFDNDPSLLQKCWHTVRIAQALGHFKFIGERE